MMYTLPETVTIRGKDFRINTDFRCILDIMEVLNDRDLLNQERAFLALGFFYPDVSDIPKESMDEAIKLLFWFIRGGTEERKEKQKPKLMDWQRDFPYIIAPVNKIVGHEVRADAHFHWWTFLAAYMEIGESLFSQIIKIRQLRAEGKKLDKADAEWYRRNREIVDMPTKWTAEEEDLMRLWGGVNNGG